MGNRFDAYLAGRLAATEPTLSTTQDGKQWAKFRLAVEDRARNEATAARRPNHHTRHQQERTKTCQGAAALTSLASVTRDWVSYVTMSTKRWRPENA